MMLLLQKNRQTIPLVIVRIELEKNTAKAFGEHSESCEVVKSTADREVSRCYTLKRGGKELEVEYTSDDLMIQEKESETDAKTEGMSVGSGSKDVEGAEKNPPPW